MVRRLVEHQVLEQMRQPRLAGSLVPRADAKPRVITDRWGRTVDERQHGQPVAQPKAPERERIAERMLANERPPRIALSNAVVEPFDQDLRRSHGRRSLLTQAVGVKPI